jgi:hypothetical protein
VLENAYNYECDERLTDVDIEQMKSKILLPLLVLAIVAVSFYALRPATLDDPPPPAVPANDQLTLDVATKDVATIERDQSVRDGLTEDSSSGIDANTEIVHGMRVRKDRNCTVELNYVDAGDGNVIEAYSCTPNQAAEPDEFDQYTNETLAGMAYSDASAAEALGKRLAESDLESARELMIRSAALRPENPQSVLWLASAYYGLVAVNGEPAINEMMENYVLARLAEELGTSGAANGIKGQLAKAGFEDKDFRQLEDVVNAELTTVREIQLEVTGSSELAEASP